MNLPLRHEQHTYTELRDRGLNQLENGEITAAAEALARACTMRPELAEAHVNLANVFEKAGQLELARRAYAHALRLDSTDARARIALAGLPVERHEFEVGQVVRASTSPRVFKVLQVKKGGFGTVYLVSDIREGTIRALKTFQAQFLWSDQQRRAFEREALTWIMLPPHPNIVRADFLMQVEGFPCLLLEYVSGGDLSDAIALTGIAPAQVIELGIQFCDGMQFAHDELGIVHRDVKPSNCLLTEQGNLKVGDFGLARAFGAGSEGLVNVLGGVPGISSEYSLVSGTIPYMAPEQFEPGPLDIRADIYSFGVMLYQALSGLLPKDGRLAEKLILSTGSSPALPAHLIDLVLNCVRPDKGARPNSFAQVRQALTDLAPAFGVAGRPIARPDPMTKVEWANRGGALSELGRYSAALECYDKALQLEPTDSGLWRNRGFTLLQMGRPDQALEAFERGLEIDPEELDLMKNKGAALGELGRYDEALSTFEQGLAVHTKDRDLLLNRGTVLAKLHRHEEALASFEATLAIDDRDADAWNAKAMTLTSLGRTAEALRACDDALRITPHNSKLWYSKGFALYALDQWAEALACFDRGIAINPAQHWIWAGKAAALSRLRRESEAAQCRQRAVELGGTL